MVQKFGLDNSEDYPDLDISNFDISNLKWEQPSEVEKKGWTYFYNIQKNNKVTSTSTSGFRLPNIKELYAAYKKNVAGFNKDEVYWSSSTSGGKKNDVWTLDFSTGSVGVANKDREDIVGRLVKGKSTQKQKLVK